LTPSRSWRFRREESAGPPPDDRVGAFVFADALAGVLSRRKRGQVSRHAEPPQDGLPDEGRPVHRRPSACAAERARTLLQLRGAARRPLWLLHDGPPYSNAHLHLGTAANKIWKDAAVRSPQRGLDSPRPAGTIAADRDQVGALARGRDTRPADAGGAAAVTPRTGSGSARSSRGWECEVEAPT
jgi:hypothetical protein